MSQLLKTAQAAITALHQQEDKSPLDILDDLETIQEHLEKAIGAVQDDLCGED